MEAEATSVLNARHCARLGLHRRASIQRQCGVIHQLTQFTSTSVLGAVDSNPSYLHHDLPAINLLTYLPST